MSIISRLDAPRFPADVMHDLGPRGCRSRLPPMRSPW